MPLILYIDTAVSYSSICLAKGKNILGASTSQSVKDSASWLQVAIKDLLSQTNYNIDLLDAIAISAGPGSYTGLRVGMSTAKGLCYALSIPLININTLQIMAASIEHPITSLLCPMIDARRMEVFTALYDKELNEVMTTTPLILNEDSFSNWLTDNTICFFGNGSTKAASLIHHSNATFIEGVWSASNMVALGVKRFEEHEFSDLAYSEPLYGKAFHSSIPNINY